MTNENVVRSSLDGSAALPEQFQQPRGGGFDVAAQMGRAGCGIAGADRLEDQLVLMVGIVVVAGAAHAMYGAVFG